MDFVLKPRHPHLGALDRGIAYRIKEMAMSSVTTFLISMSIFKMVSCRMSNLRNGLCHVNYLFSHVDRLHVDFKK